MPILQGIAAAPSPPHHAQYGNASASSSTSAYNGSQHHPQQQHHAQHPNALAGNGMSVAGPSSSSHQPSASLTALTTAASLMREGPRDFTVIKAVGDGSFGTVCLADWKSPLPSGTMLSPMQHPTTRPEYVGKRLVAIKRMKKPFKSWNDCMRLKELKSLLDIPHHPNIIPLYDAFLDPTSKELHFVFECMEGNLYQLTKSRKGRPLAGGLVASIFKQIISGLHHIHSHGYFHRDMKPENLLITTTGLDDYPASKAGAAPERDVIVIVKLADFGLARETASVPPYTEYVSTRWYRAPEVLLRSRDYSNPVDMWALGTILAELVNLKPLFPGESEVDQVTQICEVLGDPSPDYGVDSKGRVRGGGPWERGIRMAASVGFQWPRVPPIKFASLFSSRVPMELIQCIEDLLRYDPHRRATTADCIAHPYFSQIAPRLLPIKGRAPAASASRAPAPAPLGVDPTAARSALPPSHSHMAPNARPAFGEASPQQQRDASSQQRIPFYRPPQPQQPHLQHSQQRIEESLPIYRGGGGGYPEHQYPNVPESVSMQSMSSQQGSEMHDYGNAAAPPTGPWLSVPSQGSRNPSFSLTRPTQQQLGVAAAGAYSGESFPRGSFDAQSSVSGPVDPKKAKKEADKAAKQAEKAKRLAQEKAARDRARAVMQKRNQILAASTVKEQVEWLSSSSPPGPGGRQSDKSRGKQSTSNASSQSSQAPGLSPLESPNSPYSPSPYSPAHRGPPPSQFFEMRDNGRPISMQSYATGDSDPGPQGRRQMAGYPNHLQRQGSASSLSSGLDIMAAQHHQPQGYHPGRLYHASQGGSFDSFRSGGHGGEGSLDHQLVSNMEAMSAAERQSGSVSPAPIHLIGGRPSISRQSGKSRSRASSIHRAGSASPLHHTMAPRFHPYGLSGPPPPSSHSQSSSHSHFSGGIHLPSLQQSLEEERRRSGASLPRPAGPGRRSSQSQSRPNASQGSAWSAGGGGGDSTVGGGGGPAYGYHSPPPGAPVSLHYGRGGSGSDGSGGGGGGERGVNPMWGGGYASDHRGPYEQSGGGPVGSSPVPNPSPSGFGQGGRLPPISTLMSAAEGGDDRGVGGGGGGEAMDSEMSYYDGAHRQQAGYPQQHPQQQQQQQHPQYQQYQHQQQTSPLAHRR